MTASERATGGDASTRARRNSRKLPATVEQLRALIAREKLRAGDRLPGERELAATLGITRGDVRRGIGYLAALGSLEVHHGRGAFLSPAAVPATLPAGAEQQTFAAAHLFEARIALETELVALAAQRRTPAQLTVLAAEVDGMAASLGDARQFLIHDVRFHRAIAAASGNPVLAGMMEHLAGAFYQERQGSAGDSTVRARTVRMHRQILRALRAADAAGARVAMGKHLSAAARGK